jgi:alpha-ketoglutarate-dependent taurine dioxygenase
MNKQNIHDKWGTIYELDSLDEFYNQGTEFWRKELYDRKLIIFKRMKINKFDYAKICMHFGKIWDKQEYSYSFESTETIKLNNKFISLSPFSNKISGKIGMREMPWHADIPNKKIKPFPTRALWMCRNPNPESGLTTWLNISEGIDYLSQELKDKISDIKIVQQSWWVKGTEVDTYDFIKQHPVTRQQSLRLNYFNDPEANISDAWIKNVIYKGEVLEPKPILSEYSKLLQSFPELVYVHKWDDFDMAIYDNWPFVHRRSKLEFDPTLDRLFYRANIDHLDNEEWSAYKDEVQLKELRNKR